MRPLHKAFWTPDERHRYKKFGAPVVCKHCRRLGFHPRDLEGYTCGWCKGTFGAVAFRRKRGHIYISKQELSRGKYPCKQCLQAFDHSRLGKRACRQHGEYVRLPDDIGSDTHRRVICIACLCSCDDRLPCAKCHKAYVAEYWSACERELFIQTSAPLVCKDCLRNGYHQEDLNTFVCQACSCSFGGLMFSPDCIDRYRQTNSAIELVCRHCEPHACA